MENKHKTMNNMPWTVQFCTRALFASLRCKKSTSVACQYINMPISQYITVLKDKPCICNVEMLLSTMIK